jgi:hypothetical protein
MLACGLGRVACAPESNLVMSALIRIERQKGLDTIVVIRKSSLRERQVTRQLGDDGALDKAGSCD